MGKFIILQDLPESERIWNVPGYYGSYQRFSVDEWDTCFPYQLYIQQSQFCRTSTMRVEVRRWIERHLEGDVALRYKEFWNRYCGKDHCYEFCFELESDQLMFKLQWHEYVYQVPDNTGK